MDNGELNIHIVRGALTESRHIVHLAVMDINRKLIVSAGDSTLYTFARSTAKLLQAIPLLEAGGAERLHLDDKQITLLCASHNGEDEHARLVDHTLHQLDLDESALCCEVHEPFHEPTAERLKQANQPPTPLRNNCSGKHTGMLALAQIMGVSNQSYIEINHPVQQRMLHVIADMSRMMPEQITLGTDGCGVPVFAMPLEALAFAYAQLGNPVNQSASRSEACNRIIGAISREPYYIAGSDRFDTRLIEVTNGRIIGKMGAEGLFALTIPEKSWGIALKIEDGALRALYPAVMETLIQLNLLQEQEIVALHSFHRPAIKNCHDQIVGSIQPNALLKWH
ncbi:asparaginase [Paenibacillus sp. WQ 127069]|uniref:Asparaginase n=1 Tax=Paenibacillus baimaensis TaxID=2982185 RepID=A0ABT2UMD2_9BACL|nr:asparaginase [Paenibacillus sp. WQ 127069]MCU6795246.1 asparaginase [Paenibacillus sp. WQ 127069]